MPVFGGWLRNVEDEGMPATFAYQRELAQQADRTGWDVTLVAELNLNDIKGPEADCLEAWTTAAALAPLTQRLELMAAVRPNFRLPALVAKEAATIDQISNGRFTLNVVSAWWQQESDQYGGAWVEHDERYARTEEFLAVLKGMWTKSEYTLEGRYYTIKNARLAPKPVQKPWPVLYAGGESPAAKDLIARECDAYLMHGDPPEALAAKIEDMRARRAKHPELPPLRFGVAGYAIVRNSDAEVKKEVAASPTCARARAATPAIRTSSRARSWRRRSRWRTTAFRTADCERASSGRRTRSPSKCAPSSGSGSTFCFFRAARMRHERSAPGPIGRNEDAIERDGQFRVEGWRGNELHIEESAGSDPLGPDGRVGISLVVTWRKLVVRRADPDERRTIRSPEIHESD